MKAFRKNNFIFSMALAAIFTFLLPVNIWADDIYVFYEQKQEKLITKNLVYSAYRQITNQGMRDFYVLRVPLNDPNITVKSVESLKEYGLKETTQSLLTQNNAIAGVNGDFFGMKGDYSAPFGTVINNSKLISLNPNINSQKDEYSSFIIDNDNNPFMAYVKSEIEFLNDGKKNIDVTGVNKITDMVFPTYIDRNAMQNTKSLDQRFPGLVKLVIENDKITYISKKGESVDIPEDGYIITMSSHTADYNLNKFQVGQDAKFSVKSSVDLGNINTMFGGVGRILVNGKIANDNGKIVSGRQPRSALGLTFDKNTLIIIVVDGRSHSIGANQKEMAQLMQRFGAYNAMHLDSGGSSTMVVQDLKTENLNVVNTLSDGIQRKVINAVGIFKPKEMGEITSIEIEPQYEKLLLNIPCKLKIYGYDDYLNKIEIPLENVAIIADEDSGSINSDNVFVPSKTGKIKLLAQYENLTAEKEIECSQINCIEPAKGTFDLNPDQIQDLIINAIDDDGVKFSIDNSNLKFSVEPETLGKVEDGKFTAIAPGTGYAKCNLFDVDCYIKINIGAEKTDIDLPHAKKFSDKLNIDFDDTTLADDNFDVICFGNMCLNTKEKPTGYKETIKKYLTSAKQKATLGLSVGKLDENLDIKTFKQHDGYSLNKFKNLTVVNLTAKNGCLFKTNAKQWQTFQNNLQNQKSDFIIIMLDKNPKSFVPNKEYELFHSVLKKFADDGKKIFVLYNNELNTNVNVKDKIRYVNLGSLFKNNKAINPNYKSIKFRVSDKNIFYRLV